MNDSQKSEIITAFLQFRSEYDDLNLQCDNNSVAEYGIGGQTIYLGYYCPSIIFDTIVGKANRGKIIRKDIIEEKAGPFDYIYFKDLCGRLIKVEKYENYDSESVLKERSFFRYQENEIIIATYAFYDSEEPVLSQLCVCDYEKDRPIKYSLFTALPVSELSEEELFFHGNWYCEDYCYDKNSRLHEVTVYRSIQNHSQTEKISFSTDANGNIVSYQPDGNNGTEAVYKVPKVNQRTIKRIVNDYHRFRNASGLC